MRPLSYLLAICCLFSCMPDRPRQQRIPSRTTYAEQHRPQYHFTPDSMWMNDPNGMVYAGGEYHLFFQHYPDSNVWGPMHWGHAVSKDLIHWKHLPIALAPDSLGYIFSGSAVVDEQNTSGLGEKGQPPLIAMFTYHDPKGEQAGRNDFQTQGLAYSLDRGRTWTKYADNPVLANPGIRDFRDPKVFWHAETQRWIMTLAAQDHIVLYTSPDLKQWEKASEFGRESGAHGGGWECPDLFPLPIANRPGEQRWVMLVSISDGGPNGGSATQYVVGDFDGKTFTLDPGFARSLGQQPAYVPRGQVFADFEGPHYGDWQAEGEALGVKPVVGMLYEQNPVQGYQGQRLVNTFRGGNTSTGTLTSPRFVIEQPFLNFQIGGGNWAGQACLNLVVDGQVVRTATGSDSEQLRWTSWDVSELVGDSAYLQVVDRATGEWGHVLVDQIMCSKRQARPAYEQAHWVDWGKDNYAGVTWSDVPAKDGRRLFMGWMSNWQYATVVPTYRWRSAMTLPRSLSLRQTDEGIRLYSQPVSELISLRQDPLTLTTHPMAKALRLDGLHSASTELELVMSWDSTETPRELSLRLSNEAGDEVLIGVKPRQEELYVDRRGVGQSDFSPQFAGRHTAWHPITGRRVRLRVFYDQSSVEVFADEGRTVMTELVFPRRPFTHYELLSQGGTVLVESARAWPMQGIWPHRQPQ